MDLQEVKDFLRVDSTAEDLLIQGFILAAENYLANAGVKVKGELYDLVVKMLVALFYENRNPAEDKVDVPPVIRNFITQLALRGDVTPPDAPKGLAATAGNQLVNLTWNPNAEGDLAGYNVYQGGAKITSTLLTNASYQVTGLINGVTYTFQVSAVDNSGNESTLSTAVRVTPTT
ncbi:head-tail connector protein [Paenibacillus alkalitolerans]|uniref:head-tail connector protein n=1 Tax=Paenibacillus alkalitolerans TaxID=2799335 RepID=UPI0018F795EA|nr:head-tail connector protein [Paenibacillus alkalitolerans]